MWSSLEATDVAMLLRALDFAAEKHRHQKRLGEDATPYVNHLIRVTRLLAEHGVRDSVIICAAVLHDTLEDTRTTAAELDERFGEEVRRLVEEVTDDKSLPKQERKRLQIELACDLSPGARVIKIADKIANVMDVTYAPPAGWSLERRVEYVEWAAAVVEQCRGTNETLEREWDAVMAAARNALRGAKESESGRPR